MEQNLKELLVVDCEGVIELRAYFDNGRAHSVAIHAPRRATQVAVALATLAEQIAEDSNLRSIEEIATCRSSGG